MASALGPLDTCENPYYQGCWCAYEFDGDACPLPASWTAEQIHYYGQKSGSDPSETWWATAWADVEGPVPAGGSPAGEVGFAIHAGSMSVGCGGMPVPPSKRAVIIEYIRPGGAN